MELFCCVINELATIKGESKLIEAYCVMMKVICSLLVLLAVFQASQCRAPKFTERLNLRTPFFKRQRIGVSPAIVGGISADIADHPHHLGLLDLSVGGYICGASIISPLWSLSAAHCLEYNVPASLVNFE